MTPEDAGRRIRAVMADKDHAYHDPRHPQHRDAMEVMRGLYGIAYPGTEPQSDDMQAISEQARSAIREHEANTDFMTAYLEPRHAGHAEAAKTMRELYASGYPEHAVEDVADDAG